MRFSSIQENEYTPQAIAHDMARPTIGDAADPSKRLVNQ
jgi:hypothetical protein